MADDRRDDTFTVDRQYLAGQARDALGLFLAPLSGLYRAMTAPMPDRIGAEPPARALDVTSR